MGFISVHPLLCPLTGHLWVTLGIAAFLCVIVAGFFFYQFLVLAVIAQPLLLQGNSICLFIY